jgi:excisionase family DNA binding protein
MPELTTATERLLTPDDVAKRLAVSRSMVYALVKTGKLRALHVGRLPRVTEADFAAYLAGAGRPVTPETGTR